MRTHKIEHAPMVRLGDLIELCDERNSEGKYGIDDVRGMTISKEIISTKADIKDTDLSKFYIVYPNEFIYNPRTHGKKIGLGFNNSLKPILISWNNTAFKVKDIEKVEPTYLYMIFNREEWDREACYNSWGSSTVVFAWEDLCNMKIPLPSIETQKELVAVYNGLKELAEENEKLLEPLEESCQAFIVDCKKKYPSKELGNYIEECDERNESGKYTLDDVRGISTEKKIIETKANLDGVSLTSYKIVMPDEFVYVADTSRRGEKIALALNDTNSGFLISSIYTTFRSKDENILLPEYLYLLLSRTEFDRYSRFNSWGSARETFDWSEMCRVQIPVPPLEIQQKIVNLFNCYEECKRISTTAREKIKNLCPALVQKAAHSE
ncbi:restriction endonuclease subunit S [uncultured Treponema sp.]|uniref:restriction endonuclease subunit S n=1 Tax=uncultured Treponema sp. TaxID=162155 RepID=UPI0025972CFC|nr:restriction endonuclease subunit S [uncultured Treponema sp.]